MGDFDVVLALEVMDSDLVPTLKEPTCYAQILDLETGTMYHLKEESEIVGRNPEALIQIKEVHISRVHCILRRTPNNKCILIGKGRFGNVFVNDSEDLLNQEVELAQGDIIKIYDWKFIFHYVPQENEDKSMQISQDRAQNVNVDNGQNLTPSLPTAETELLIKEHHKLLKEKQEKEFKLLQAENEKMQLLENYKGMKRKVEAVLDENMKLKQDLNEISKEPTTSSQPAKLDGLLASLECGICAELCIETIQLPCVHRFCKQCITTWKKKKKECPMCRTPIVKEVKDFGYDQIIEQVVLTLPEEQQRMRKELIEQRNQVPAKKRKSQGRPKAQDRHAQRIRARVTPRTTEELSFSIESISTFTRRFVDRALALGSGNNSPEHFTFPSTVQRTRGAERSPDIIDLTATPVRTLNIPLQPPPAFHARTTVITTPADTSIVDLTTTPFL